VRLRHDVGLRPGQQPDGRQPRGEPVRIAIETFEEWEKGIAFLTDTGKMCSDTRQEFVLLSDTLGVSMLVDAINHGAALGVTASTVLGPFYVEGLPEREHGEDISGGLEGDPLVVTGTVNAPDGTPIKDAIVDVWHSDGDGYYDVQQLEETGGLAMRARFSTDGDGKFSFWSIRSPSEREDLSRLCCLFL
jgi:hydroxyquinol 1,2-dioxygenase